MTNNSMRMNDLIAAAECADWQQVVSNGGPPCFHVESGRFCLRAKRWAGHEAAHFTVQGCHLFVDLATAIAATTDPVYDDRVQFSSVPIGHTAVQQSHDWETCPCANCDVFRTRVNVTINRHAEDIVPALEREIADASKRINAAVSASIKTFLDTIQAHIRAKRECES